MDSYSNILRLYNRSQYYKKRDPEVAVMLARKTAEAMCKFIATRMLCAEGNSMMLEKLIEQLTTAGILPKKIINSFRIVQTVGNYGAHDQNNEYDSVDAKCAAPCIQSLEVAYEWFHDKLGKKEEFIRKSVNEIALSVRAANTLNNADVLTVSGLIQLTRKQAMKQFGKTSFVEIERALTEMGCEFKGEAES